MANESFTPGDQEAERPSGALQFSLRHLFLGVAAIAVVMAAILYLGTLFLIFAWILALCGGVFLHRRKFKGDSAKSSLLTIPLVKLYLFSVLGGALAVLLLMPTTTGGHASPHNSCGAYLKNIILALHNYHDDQGSFPPAYFADDDGEPMHSWRVLILPYIEEADLYAQYRFDEPWDGPNNQKLHDQIVHVYCCPSQSRGGNTTTNYVAVVGPDTAWPGSESIRYDDLKDGPSETILLVEVADSDIHWMEPRDLRTDQMSFAINSKPGKSISSNHPRGAHIGFCNAAVHALSEKTTLYLIDGLLTIDGGEDLSAYKLGR